ncbi:hypothetical protein FKW77_002849 [Venturia effusa]|uniref:Uncharacterized protein n=1 Tax=Venturia effusa TaxID=50376 RepID=A0A517KZ83_9PEZI|nr:hypothetical protein FKW77_002849 [Venturia effusa]
MSIITETPQNPDSPKSHAIPVELITQCSSRPEVEDWKTKYEILKAEYDDLRAEYELLQDKCNNMVSTLPVISECMDNLYNQVNHGDGTVEDGDTYTVWRDGDESEV